MAKKQGKIKSISVKEIAEGIQVYHTIEEMILIFTEERHLFSLNKAKVIDKSNLNLIHLKTFVVEYKECCSKLEDQNCEGAPGICGMTIKQLPLKYSQWQNAIDNNEVDSDKVVEFFIETFAMDSKRANDNATFFARIIPQNKRLYSEEDILEFEKWLYKEGYRNNNGVISKGNIPVGRPLFYKGGQSVGGKTLPQLLRDWCNSK